jgi:hypothetical protein
MRTHQFTLKDILKSFGRKKVLSKSELLQEHGCSPMTLWRLLRQAGYITSYNHNAKYYTLATTPQFDDHGLWAYDDVRFSRWGTLPGTVVGSVEQSSGGMTAREVEQRLLVRNAKPLLTDLVSKGWLWREGVAGSFVYASVEPSRHEQQLRRRKEQAPVRRLPEPQQIVALLVEMIRHPRQGPRQWALHLARHDIRLGTEEIRAVIEHYDLSVKKGLLNA